MLQTFTVLLTRTHSLFESVSMCLCCSFVFFKGCPFQVESSFSRIMQQQLQAEVGGLLGALVPGKRKLLGKTFYLDNVKKRPAALILETISLLGGVSGEAFFLA